MDSSSSSDSEDDFSLVMAQEEYDLLIVRAALSASLSVVNIFETGDGDYSVNPNRLKTDRLGSLLSAHASVFRMNVGFSLVEFEELCSSVCPVLEMCAPLYWGDEKRWRWTPSQTFKP
jgi:hypothetical protein